MAKNLERSQQAFIETVWPAVKYICGGGVIIPVESVSDSGFAKDLDTLAGIDAWQQLTDVAAGDVLRGIASRVQWTLDPYNTFTVRRSVKSGAPTEYSKRLAALNGRGFLHPHLTIQAYIHKQDGSLLSVGVAKTADVISAVKLHRWRPNPKDGSTFYWISFSDVKDIKLIAALPLEAA